MKKFALKIILFMLLFLIGNRVYTLWHPDSDVKNADQRLSFVLSGDMNKDVIIAGASSGSAGIMAGRIEEETGLSAYNLCYLGSNIEFHEFIVRSLVEFNDPPKILLIVVDDSIEFKPTSRATYKKDQLYPLVKSKYIRKELAKREGKGKLVSGAVAFIRAANFNVNRKLKHFDNYLPYLECGSRPIPVNRHKAGVDWTSFSSSGTYSADDELEEKLNAFHNILAICDDLGIIPVIVFPPIYPAHGAAFQDRVIRLLENEALYFAYDKDNPIYRNHDYYYDAVHLKENGADIFTSEIIEYIKALELPR